MKIFVVTYDDLKMDEEIYFTLPDHNVYELKQRVGNIVVAEDEMLKGVHLVDLTTETITPQEVVIKDGKLHIQNKENY